MTAGARDARLGALAHGTPSSRVTPAARKLASWLGRGSADSSGRRNTGSCAAGRTAGWAGRQRRRGLQQPGAGGGVLRAFDATAAAQLGVRSDEQCVDDLVGDITPYDERQRRRQAPAVTGGRRGPSTTGAAAGRAVARGGVPFWRATEDSPARSAALEGASGAAHPSGDRDTGTHGAQRQDSLLCLSLHFLTG